MSIAAEIFGVLVTLTGAVTLFGLTLWVLGGVLMRTFKLAKAWHQLLLVVAVQLHGRAYRDRLFWQAMEEHINGNPFAAKLVSEFANRCAPFNEETSI